MEFKSMILLHSNSFDPNLLPG